jgi:beta-fructofuranosidase
MMQQSDQDPPPWPGGAAEVAGGPPDIDPETLDALLRTRAWEAVAKMSGDVSADPWRQGFHIQPPAGLLNDPNGLVMHQGVYHLCYQWHPFGPRHALKYWAHVTSTDMVRWSEPAIALAPSQPYESHGCYSGSGLVVNDTVRFLYTGNARTSDGGRTPFQLLASLTASGAVAKEPANPLLGALPGCTPHVRDPKVWADTDGYWMILGAQTDDQFGTALLLHSEDLLDWKPLGPIAGGPTDPYGYMWECPDLIRMPDRDVLVISPQLDRGEGVSDRWVDESVYAVGSLSGQPPRFDRATDFMRVDHGPDFYAPQSFVTEDGRTVMVAWMGMPDHEGQPVLADKHPTVARGWVHCLTVPRELSLADDRLVQQPVAEVASLRGEQLTTARVELDADATSPVPVSAGRALDIELSVSGRPGGVVTVSLRDGASARPVLLTVDPVGGTATLDRRLLGTGEGGVFSGRFRGGPTVDIRILLDHSSVEVFIDGGRLAMSARIYPPTDDDRVTLSASGQPATVTVAVWSIE